MNLLPAYQSLLQLSAQMAAMAEHQDWEALGRLQAQRADLISALPACLPALSAAEADTLRTIINQIQTYDATVLEYAEPSRAQIGALISRLTPVR